MRIDIDTYTEIAQTLSRNKSRTILTGFGIFWGVFMLLFLMGGGRGFKQMMSANFEGFATNMSAIFSNETTKPYKGFGRGRGWDMSLDDVERLKRAVPELETVSPMVSRWGVEAAYGTRSFSSILKGVYQDYARIEEPKILYGRYINEMDVIQERKVCVIGKRVYEELFPAGVDPCGENIKVGDVYYQIVGVNVAPSAISINGPSSEAVFIPMSIMQKIYNIGGRVAIICMTARSGVKTSTLEPKIRQIIYRANKIDPSDIAAMSMMNIEEMFALVDNLFTGINILIMLIGIGTILAGAIGVSNIMIVTVKERTTEIGIRRAIGATPSDVLSQIILESISLTLLSGLLGIVFTVPLLRGLEFLANQNSEFYASFQIDFWTAIIAAVCLAVLGVIAGLAPASRAMHIKPVDAMRDE